MSSLFPPQRHKMPHVESSATGGAGLMSTPEGPTGMDLAADFRSRPRPGRTLSRSRSCTDS